MNLSQPQLPVSKYINPNWQQARLHGLASTIGKTDENNLQFCHCCLHHIVKKPIALSQNTKEVLFLGFGVPLYFAFVRNCILILIVIITCYSIPSLHYALVHNRQFCQSKSPHFTKNQTISTKVLAQNENKTLNVSETPPHFSIRSYYQHASKPHSTKSNAQKIVGQQSEISQQEKEIQCTGWMIYLSRIESSVSTQQHLFRFGSFFVHFILLIYIRDKLTKMKYYFDQRSLSPSDFAVFVKNMPPQKGQRAALKRFIKEQYGIEEVHDIILIPDLQNYQSMQTQQQLMVHELQKKAKKYKKSTDEIKQLQIKIERSQAQIQQLIRNAKNNYESDNLEAERALVLFDTQIQKWRLIYQYQKTYIPIQQWSYIVMSQASQPDQIIWSNTMYSSSEKKFFKFLGWFASIMTLLLITAIFIVISHFKSNIVLQKIIQYHENKQQRVHLFIQAFIIVMALIFLIVLFNKFVLSHLFHKFTEIQKHSNTYKFQFYYCLKYCLGLFFTTALMTLIIEDFLFHNIFQHNFGVIEQQTIMFLFNSIFVPLFWLIHPMLLVKKCKRWRNLQQKHITQKQANTLMQYPRWDIGKRYGEVLQIMWFTFLYMTIIPVGAVFSCLGLLAYYWVDKYNLLRRSSIQGQVSGDLINLTLNMLQFTLVLRILGEMLFDYQIRKGITPVSWAYLIISLAYVIIPAQALVNLVNQQRFQYQKLRYSQAQHLFKTTYINSHILFNRLPQDKEKIYLQKINRKMQRNVDIKNIRKKQDLIKMKQDIKFVHKI